MINPAGSLIEVGSCKAVAHPYFRRLPTAAVGQVLGAIANLIAVYCRLWRLDVRYECGLPRARLRRSVYHRFERGGHRGVTRYAVPMNPVQRSGAIPLGSDAPSFPACPACPARCGFCAWSTCAFFNGLWLCCYFALPAMILSPTFFRHWPGR
jgi:hypothetical protein